MSTWNRFASGSSLAILAAALVAPAAVYAQETTAEVRGSVSSSSTPVTGAVIVVTHLPSGTRSSIGSNANGQFVASGLRVGGPYRVEVSADGFQPKAFDDLFVLAGEPFSILVDLQRAEANVERVVVTARAIGGAAADGASSTSLRRDAIEGVVAINRDIRELARRSPLVSQNTRGDGGISIAGSNPRTNRITIDGTAAQDDFGLNTGGLPTRRGPVSLDAIQQFTVSATPFDVRNGGFLGGAIDVVLRAGDNEFAGSAFANFLADELTGARIANTPISNKVEQTNWGATFRGPIIKDRLFFALAYETFESVDSTDRGPAGLGFANTITGPTGSSLTQAEIDAVTNVFRNTYGSDYAFGSITATKPITDEKMTARFDWNINDKHRAQLTYRASESGLIQRTNLNQTSAGLDSQWYLTGEDDKTLSVQLNSNWTDALSTEVRISRREYTRLQEPPGGQNFSDIRVCASATSLDSGGVDPLLNCRAANGTTGIGVVRWGPDQFRHANFLETSNDQVQFEARYLIGDHTIKGGLQYQSRDVFNLFVPNSRGTYYFDSIADFTAGRANQLVFGNNPSGDPNQAAAVFNYTITSAYLQDLWRVSDRFRVTGGLRYDVYGGDDKPVLNTNFVARNGFDNQKTYDGLSILMPRVSFKWDATDKIEVNGGIGLFSGGLPDVFLSNSFSNTGVLTAQVDIRRNADGTFRDASASPGFTQALGAVALNGLATSGFGKSIPASILALLTLNPANETNSISKSFDIPSEWKLNLSAKWDDAIAGVDLSVDGVYAQVQTGLAFRDIRAVPLVVNGQRALTPDGRLRYDALSTAQRTSIAGTTVNSIAPVGGGNRDIQAYNPDGDLGRSFVLAVSASKQLTPSLRASVSATVQDIEELSNAARFSSTASSLYATQFSDFDPNLSTYGRGQEEIRYGAKYEVEWRGTPIGDLETRVSLFGDWREGRPISFVMNGGSSRNAVFGVNKGGQLAFIPDLSGATNPITTITSETLRPITGPNTLGNVTTVTIPSDGRVSFDSLATLNSLVAFVNRFNLPQNGILPRGIKQSDPIHLVDMKFSQQLPGFRRQDKAFFTLEFGNVLNMINEDWGIVEDFPEDIRVFDVTCADATGVGEAGASGGATIVRPSATLACTRYRISGVNDPSVDRLRPTRNTDKSRWQIQVGFRYEF
jgi:Carboxypeptidase regulatory-like domain/TonB dependent receptor